MGVANPLLGSNAIEMTTFSGGDRDIELGLPRNSHPTESFCGHVIRDYMEITPCALAVAALAFVFFFGLFGAGAYYIANTDFLKWGGVAVGATGAVFSCTVCCVGSCSCLMIRHLRPEKNLEGQIEKLGKTIRDYETQIRDLGAVNKHLENTSNAFKRIAIDQERIKGETEKMLEGKVAELAGVNEEFQKSEQHLEEMGHVLEQFKQQIAEANTLNDQITVKIREASQHLPELGFVHDGTNDSNGATMVDIGGLSDANLAFDAHNKNLEGLNGELRKQLEMMQSFETMLAKYRDLFKQGLSSFSDNTNTLLDTAKILDQEVEKREVLQREMLGELQKWKDAVLTIRAAILKIKDPQLQSDFKPILEMLDALNK